MHYGHVILTHGQNMFAFVLTVVVSVSAFTFGFLCDSQHENENHRR